MYHCHETTNESEFGSKKIAQMSWKNAFTFTKKHAAGIQKLSYYFWKPYWNLKSKHYMKSIRKQYSLLGLLVFAFLVRIGYLLNGVIPFGFDHGKDSLAVMHMLLTQSLKFVGPWTSIPGLYFGPAWYYLLAPFYLLFNFNPIGPVFAMILLVMVQIILAYRYLGKTAAIILATAPTWLMISKSAWNPFPMTFVSLVVIIILKDILETKKITVKKLFLLGMIASFGFHFSAAFAIFYLPIISSVLAYARAKMNIKDLIALGMGFCLPFVPQLLFEIKNSFIQTRSVIAYFTAGEPHEFGIGKVSTVISTVISTFQLSVLPEFLLFPSAVNMMIQLILVVGLGYSFWSFIRDKKHKHTLVLVSVFSLIPLLGYMFLHFNVWYVLALAPAFVVLVSQLLDTGSNWFRKAFLLLLLLSPLFSYVHYFQSEKSELEKNYAFLPIKREVLKYIYTDAGERPFSVYTYAPDVYDYAYQYLFFVEARKGRVLPTEFSYKPGEVAYAVEKPELLHEFSQPESPPEVIYYIVEKPLYPDFLDSWWNSQSYGTIEEEVVLSDSLTVYKATPKSNN